MRNLARIWQTFHVFVTGALVGYLVGKRRERGEKHQGAVDHIRANADAIQWEQEARKHGRR